MSTTFAGCRAYERSWAPDNKHPNEDGNSNGKLHHIVQGTIQNDSKKDVRLPYLMKFQGLEIDGVKNQVLYCVGKVIRTDTPLRDYKVLCTLYKINWKP